MMAKHAKTVLFIGALGISVSAILTRFSNAPSMVLALYRMTMAALCLLPVALTKHRAELKNLDKKTFLIALLGGVFLAFHFTCYFEGVYRTSVAAATILCNTQVFFAAILTVLLFREKLSKPCLAAIALTFLGGVLIALSPPETAVRSPAICWHWQVRCSWPVTRPAAASAAGASSPPTPTPSSSIPPRR